MGKHCLALDLIEDADLIKEYENHHAAGNVWPEITDSIRSAGITNMEIYRTGNRLFMLMETDESFDPQRKAVMDAVNSQVQEWEKLMLKFQQPLPWAKEGEKWVEMHRIFQL